MGNTWGNQIKLSIFGESHGPAIGIVIDGLPSGWLVDQGMIAAEMARRAPGHSPLSTPRAEQDQYEILSGLFENKTTGTPLCAIIRNENTRSADYTPHLPRPGHADLTALSKYKGFADYRGGGHFSGRLTAPLVFAGAIAKQILLERGISIGARIKQIYNVQDVPMDPFDILATSRKPFPVYGDGAAGKMQQAILSAKAEGDSLGGIIECAALSVPAGLGDPFFCSLESAIASMMFSIPAVKGVEFGAGFSIAGMTGSEANDPYHIKSGIVEPITNRSGGINGGISNGQPIVFSVALRPTPTIHKEQTTVDLEKNETVQIKFGGRHDPCIVPRAVPVVEAGLALCLLDNLR